MQKNKTIIAQIISGVLKFLVAVIIIFVVIAVIIPSLLSIVNGKDISPVDDSKLKLRAINMPDRENSFYDLNKTQQLIDIKNVPKGKQLASDYLKSDEWDQEAVKQVLLDNEDALQYFTDASIKGKFQLPDADSQLKISSNMPVTPVNSWRKLTYLSGVKAIYLAKNGRSREALDEAFKSIIVGSAIENSQSLLITHLVGIAMKDNGLDILQKVVSIIPKDYSALSEYQAKLKNYQATGNPAPFITEYIVFKQDWENLGKGGNNQFGTISKVLMKNKFYFKKNLTVSYLFDFYNKLAIEAEKDCSEVKKVPDPEVLLKKNNFIVMYFTENAVGKYYMEIPSLALNNVLEKKCATEKKLKKTTLIVNNQK